MAYEGMTGDCRAVCRDRGLNNATAILDQCAVAQTRTINSSLLFCQAACISNAFIGLHNAKPFIPAAFSGRRHLPEPRQKNQGAGACHSRPGIAAINCCV
ncbi:hypothetical protein ACFOGG_14700 [Brenneria rubrifaciens]|uniref:hypothetical protein n=1 Tax=Brenneria rubrifaciens TaxID=55213 RepID=UPI00360FD220